MPVHVGVIQGRFGRQRICVIQLKWHADGEAQTLVFPGSCDPENMVKRVSSAVLTRTCSVFEIDIGHGVVLPGQFRCESDVMALSCAVHQLDVAHVKTQIRKRRIATTAFDRLTLPGGHKRNVNGLVPLTAGGADRGCGKRDKRSCQQGQVAVLLTSAASSSLAGAPPSSLSDASE